MKTSGISIMFLFIKSSLTAPNYIHCKYNIVLPSALDVHARLCNLLSLSNKPPSCVTVVLAEQIKWVYLRSEAGGKIG